MNGHKIIFDNIEWTNAGTDVRYKAFVHGNQRLRLVEFSEGFIELDWCTHGHAGIVLDGSFALDYNGNLERYGKGDVIFIPGGEVDKHKAILGKGEKVTLLLFEILKDIVQMDYIYRPITIRLAVPADAPDMAEVHMRSWEAAYRDIIPAEYIKEKNATRPALWDRVITGENDRHYVIRAEDKTAGIMTVAPPQDDDMGDDCYELHGLYLHPDYYRQGIGSRVMEFALDIARGLGKKIMTVWLLADNHNAEHFYEKCGFIADGSSRERDFGKTLKSIRMRREL